MENTFTWFNNLGSIEKISIIGSIASIISLIPILWHIFKLIILSSPNKVYREFLFVFCTPLNCILSGVIIFSFALLLLLVKGNAYFSFLLMLLISTFILLSISLFFRQSKPLIRQLILTKIENTVKKYGDECSAIKFDVDLIVAINDYSYNTGNKIVTMVHHILDKHEKELKSSKKQVISIAIPESDEVIWILPNMGDEDAADIADRIRMEVKQSLKKIPYYNEAKEFVISKLQSPKLTQEEQEGIGTVSAGVAAYARGAESLLSDISSAMKESKFRGRNRTIVYQREKPSIIREH